MSELETWKPIVGYEGTYDFSILGVRRVSTGRILKQSLDGTGRPQVTLCLRGKQTHFLVSHLVADAFLPPKSSTDQVLRHLNDNPTDNRVENLAWGTYSDNAMDAFRNGKRHSPRGTANGRAKLTKADVLEIRRLYATGKFTQRELALKFGVLPSVISKIVLRKIWKHI